MLKTKRFYFYKKIFIYLSILILSLGVLFSFVKNNDSNFKLINSNGNEDYVSQNIAIEDISKDEEALPGKNDIFTTVKLPNNKLFFGGFNGSWSVETIIEGKKNLIISGFSGGLGKGQTITSAVASGDYSESNNIMIGFGNGYVGVLNTETQEIEFPKWWSGSQSPLVDDLYITKITYLSDDDYYVYSKDGQIVDINTKTLTHEEVVQAEIDDNEVIDYTELENGNLFISTKENSFYELNPKEGWTSSVIWSHPPRGSFTTIVNIKDNDFFIGYDNGEWERITIPGDKEYATLVSEGNWSDQGKPINTSISLPDVNNSEILAAGDDGYWAIIDTEKTLEGSEEQIINSGFLEGYPRTNSIVSLDDEYSVFLFSCNEGKWFTEKPVGFVSDFDKTKTPESTLITNTEIDYKISTTNNYSLNWPLDISEYKIKSTFTLGSSSEEISFVTEENFNNLGEIKVKIKGLHPQTEYNNLKIQLLKANKKETPIGQEWETGVNFKTNVGRVIDINNAKIDDNSITSNSFNFTINDFSCDAISRDNVGEYTLEVKANIDEREEREVIWTSGKLLEAIDGTKYTVDKLSPGTKYENISVQAIYEDLGPTGSPYFFSEVFTTLNSPKSISGSIGKTTSSSLEILANIDAEDTGKNINNDVFNPDESGYYLHITSEDGIDWTSELRKDSGENISFIIDGLNPGKTYNNIKIVMSWDEDGEEPIPNCSTTIESGTVGNHAIGFQNIGEKGEGSTNIDEDGITSNSVLVNINIVAQNNDNKDVSFPYQINFYNESDDGEYELLFTSTPQTGIGPITPIEVTGLIPGTVYNLNIELTEDNGEKIITDKIPLSQFITVSSLVTSIGEITNGESFYSSQEVNIVINTNGGLDYVEDFTIKFHAKGSDGNDVEWKSGKYNKAGMINLVIEGLNYSTTYTDCTYDLIPDSQGIIKDTKVGADFSTIGIASSFSDDVSIKNVKYNSFDLSFNVIDSFGLGINDTDKINPYWIAVYDEKGNELFNSWKLDPNPKNPYESNTTSLNTSGAITITVDQLLQKTTYSDIGISFINEDGEKFGEFKQTKLSVKTKLSPKYKMTIFLSIIFIMFVITMAIFLIVILVKWGKSKKRDHMNQKIKFS